MTTVVLLFHQLSFTVARFINKKDGNSTANMYVHGRPWRSLADSYNTISPGCMRTSCSLSSWSRINRGHYSVIVLVCRKAKEGSLKMKINKMEKLEIMRYNVKKKRKKRKRKKDNRRSKGRQLRSEMPLLAGKELSDLIHFPTLCLLIVDGNSGSHSNSWIFVWYDMI